jgi:hypothetical protein
MSENACRAAGLASKFLRKNIPGRAGSVVLRDIKKPANAFWDLLVGWFWSKIFPAGHLDNHN